jgi:hypothetical protein
MAALLEILPLFFKPGRQNTFRTTAMRYPITLSSPNFLRTMINWGKTNKKPQETIFNNANSHYYYFAPTAKLHDDHFSACMEDGAVLKQQLFQPAGDPSEGDSVTLKADLISAVQNWERLCTSMDTICPLQYSPEEIDECLQLEKEQRLADDDVEKSRYCLGVSSDGWVLTERYSEAKKMSEKFKEDAIVLADSEEVAAQIQRHWPFDDHDEDE